MTDSNVDLQAPNRRRVRLFTSKSGEDVTGLKFPTNYIETLINLVKAYTGTEIFCLGTAFKHSGILLGPLLLIYTAIVNLHCQHILVNANVRIASKDGNNDVAPSYAETVQYTFEDSSYEWFKKISRSCKIFIIFCIAATQYGYCIIYYIFITHHLTEFAVANGWNVDYRIMLLVMLLPLWLSTFLTNLKALTPLSLAADLFVFVGVVTVLYYATVDLPPLKERTLIATFKKVPIFFGMIIYQFNGSTFILDIRREMKNPQKFLEPFGVLNISLFIVVIIHLLVGYFTYWKYGEGIAGSSLLNIPHKEIVATVVKLLIIIAVVPTYSLHMYIAFEITYPIFYSTYGPFEHRCLILCGYKTFWVILTYGLANISTSFGTFLGLMGALSGSVLALIVPALLEMAIYNGPPTRYVVLKNVLIIAFALLVSIAGTVSCVGEIVKEYNNNKTL